MSKWDDLDDKLDFLDSLEDKPEPTNLKAPFKILIADDDKEVHRITKVVLQNFEFEGRDLHFTSTYSGAETKAILTDQSDFAVIFLDVVMETSNSGLEVVSFLRKDLGNTMTRIILRTGQPGEAPEETVIKAYDINDYRLKTEMTVKRLYTTLYGALRNYAELARNQQYQRELERIISASSTLFGNYDLNGFLTCILEQITSFEDFSTRDNPSSDSNRGDPSQVLTNGFIAILNQDTAKIVAATGTFTQYLHASIPSIVELAPIYAWLQSNRFQKPDYITRIGEGIILTNPQNQTLSNFIYIWGNAHITENSMLRLFLSNFSMALDNFILKNLLNTTQKEIVYALANTVESHYEETGMHIQRISEMMYNFSLVLHHGYQEAEVLRLASTMHDLGKIALPDAVLKKPGPLTLEEFDVIKQHSQVGFKILSHSDLPILKIAAEIALNHHERFDGSGYPSGKRGQNIPLYARMLAIVDVFDAMTHPRVYREAISAPDAITLMKEGSGAQFDPSLLEIFLTNLDTICTTT